MTNREMLLQRVQMHDFVAYEAHLFLDTHPTEMAAIEFFKLHLAAAKAARAEYEKLYGPLVVSNAEGPSWSWVKDPWPWENLGRYE